MHIAIVGGGFCGTLLVLNLIYKSNKSFQITLIEKYSSQLAQGRAYSTQDPYHLLNVRAKKMGAFAEDPEHFIQWLSHHESMWRREDPSFVDLILHPDAFLPRKLYGVYLTHLLKQGMEVAKTKKMMITQQFNEATDSHVSASGVKLIFADKSYLHADKLVLAVGVPSNKNFVSEKETSFRYIHSLEKTFFSDFFKQNTNPQAHLVILGTGLTMLDAMTSLILRGFNGKITALSSTGLISKTHVEKNDPPVNFIDLKHLPKTSLELLKIVHKEIKKYECKSQDWRGVIDHVRDVIGVIWQQFTWKERNKAIRHLLKKWNYYRHRMPWNYVKEIHAYMQSEAFNLLKGRVLKLDLSKKDKIQVFLNSTDNSCIRLEADYVLNCSGPEMNILKNPSLLIQNLLKKGIIVPDPLNLGLKVNAYEKLAGENKGKLYALGQLLFGERLETTAIPELRQQCAHLAHLLINIEDSHL